MNGSFFRQLVCDRLTEQTGPGGLLDGVSVLYAYDAAKVTDRTIYGGGMTFERAGDADAHDGTKRLALEVDTDRIYIRLAGHGLSVKDTWVAAEAVGDQLETVIAKDPAMAGPGTDIRVAGGTGDYQLTDDGPVVILVYRLEYSGYVGGT